MSSGIYLMTCHAVIGDGAHYHEVLERLNNLLRDRFGICHSTIQLEAQDLSAFEADFCARR
jgi:Co/Zn/Cd efflux system component